MMGDIQGLIPGMVMQTDDGVLHYGVNITWGRNEAFAAFHALCDMEEKFPLTISGLIQMDLLRESGVRYAMTGHVGSSTCMTCMATSRDRWATPGDSEFG